MIRASSIMAFLLFNPIESCVVERALFNVSRETRHPIEPAVYIQIQAEAVFGVRLRAHRLSEILVQFYGYRWVKGALPILLERVDVRLAREEADTNDVFHNDALEREGLIGAIRQSIPGDVVTLSKRVDEGEAA